MLIPSGASASVRLSLAVRADMLVPHHTGAERGTPASTHHELPPLYSHRGSLCIGIKRHDLGLSSQEVVGVYKHARALSVFVAACMHVTGVAKYVEGVLQSSAVTL